MSTTTERLARFETAQELLGFVIAAYSANIYQEGKKPEPNQAQITQWLAEQSALEDLQDSLSFDDTESSERVIATYGPMVRERYKQRKSSPNAQL